MRPDFHKCHSMRRFANRCREQYWDKEDYNAPNDYYEYIYNFPEIQALKTVHFNYSKAKISVREKIIKVILLLC
ncbi:unnamed protein product [Blepharisma stoltei]|uniref:Uncharacterized protein n=1 Tax=Blepharisma stoltei TaxID=1481888 RepID=A0AAU9KE20_9CILI|nr:unnamed protein product [Blepharisma stoltei]